MGRKPSIPRTLRDEILELDLLGHSPEQIHEWISEKQITTTVGAVQSLLYRIRIRPSDNTEGEGLTDLIAARIALRRDLAAKDWRARHSAARLLLEIRVAVEEIAARKAPASGAQAGQKAYTVAASPDSWPAPPAPPDGPQPAQDGSEPEGEAP